MADKKFEVPAHLKPLFGEGLAEKAAASLERVLGQEAEKVSTSRVGRALKISGLALRSGSKLLLNKAEKLVNKDADGRGVEVALQMLETFSELRGITMKLGQMLSYIDDGLPPEAQKVLALLQRDATPMPYELVRQQVEKELGKPIDALYRRFDEKPLAAASIGQVHRAALHDGTEVAVKVQYPGIDQAMAADLKNARIMALFKGMLFYRTNTEAIMQELEDRFLDECDYLKEATYQERYRARFAGHPWIVVPQVHRELTSKGVLTTTFYHGASFYEWLAGDPPPEVRERVARLFYRFYIGSFYLDGLFNCDPHPGNYLFLNDGKVVFLDYGCSREFPRDRLGLWINLCKAVYEDNRPVLDKLGSEMGFLPPGVDYDREAFRELMRYLYEPYLTDGPFDFQRHRPADTFRKMFVNNPNLFKLNMPPDAVFLNRIGFGLVSLFTQIGAHLDCRHYASHYFEGVDVDWPEDPFRA